MPQNFRNPYLCLTVVCFIGGLAVLSTAGIIAVAIVGRDAPSALISIASTSMGALAAFLVTPPRGSVGYDPVPAAPLAQPQQSQQLIVSPAQGGSLPRPAPTKEPDQ